ncbi:cation:proton antiporter [Natrialbaceae archaeon AArc-T1-2]|uniref:cation:proton antiporter n=1 Tax=Natrialbaceae archaeon AArc-T1-2 TaxID=3053904 RepID=UPI00255A768A|nr:cation:proton antiporter [Natrialbaceae archaeon AArc-T1-2]WIV67609.1 cation:proton antiporter [Natrialbaceae archaeon AArc-T1-2]
MTDLLTTVAIVFIVAGPFLLVANRFQLPTVPLLILAGVVAGPFIDEELTLELAQYGIALLVFSFGVSVQFSGVRTVFLDSEVVALGQILVVGSLGVGFGLVFGVPVEEAIYLGIAAALSSTIVGTSLFQTEIRRDLVRGRLAEAIHLGQDLLAIVLILVLAAETLALGQVAPLVAYGLGLVVAAVLVNRYLFDVIGEFAGDSDELMIVSVISLLVVFVGAAEFAGVSIVVGAFAAGLAVRHDPVEYLGLFNGLESVRDFFVAIFFVTIGALVVLPFVEIGWNESVEKLLLTGGIVLLTAVVKPAITTGILIYQGYETRTATLTSLNTDQVSEFSLIIAIEAALLGVLSPSLFDAIILAAAVTMVTSTITGSYNEKIYRVLATHGVLDGTHRKIDEWSDVPQNTSDHVIVVGYGRQGRQLVEACEDLDQPYVVIENDPVRRDEVVSECDAFVFGDAMERYTWEKANVETARIAVSTVDSDPVSRRILSFEFDADVTLRASDEETALDLLEEGALYVTVPELLAGQRLTQYVQELLEGDLTPEELREERMAVLEERPRVGHPDSTNAPVTR